ncbi:MAG TPA: PIN domain-containing protein [Bacteroidia bacterium]|jgi:predicted nucleic acid-binding protein|nr:PIN domain-containing protein [Bacteroidia bacterium]
MKIFLDANILVSVLNKEYPVFSYSSRVLSLTENARFKVYTSPLCLAIAYYFAEKKNGNHVARQKINLLAGKLHITVMDARLVAETIKNRQIHDFEDGLQYHSAMESGCKCIVSEDTDDYYFSEIETMKSRQFLEKYVF